MAWDWVSIVQVSNPVLTIIISRCITIGFESRISTRRCVSNVKCDRWKTALINIINMKKNILTLIIIFIVLTIFIFAAIYIKIIAIIALCMILSAWLTTVGFLLYKLFIK